MPFDVSALKELVLGRRWFGPYTRAIESLRVMDEAQVAEDGELHLVLVEITSDGGPAELFHLPVVRRSDGSLADASGAPQALEELARACAEHRRVETATGAFIFRSRGWPADAHKAPRPLGAEQSNTSFVFGDGVILKLFRRVQVGHNPDVEVNRWLGEARFDGAPKYVGDVSYVSRDVANIDVGIATEFAAGSIDGWTAFTALMASWAGGAGGADPSTGTRPLDEMVHGIGTLTASLHDALGRNTDDQDFAPEQLRADALGPVLDRTRTALAEAERGGHVLMPATRTWLESFERALGANLGEAIRVHGDYHLGQLLIAPGGLRVVDFEGEPTRPLAERRRKHSPLKDVAGMLRSFGYAAAHTRKAVGVAGGEAGAEAAPPTTELDALLANWETGARAQFLTAYRQRMHEAAVRLPGREAFDALLSLYELEKALYELAYETRFRPDWVDVPTTGLVRIEARIVARKGTP